MRGFVNSIFNVPLNIKTHIKWQRISEIWIDISSDSTYNLIFQLFFFHWSISWHFFSSGHNRRSSINLKNAKNHKHDLKLKLVSWTLTLFEMLQFHENCWIVLSILNNFAQFCSILAQFWLNFGSILAQFC